MEDTTVFTEGEAITQEQALAWSTWCKKFWPNLDPALVWDRHVLRVEVTASYRKNGWLEITTTIMPFKPETRQTYFATYRRLPGGRAQYVEPTKEDPTLW